MFGCVLHGKARKRTGQRPEARKDPDRDLDAGTVMEDGRLRQIRDRPRVEFRAKTDALAYAANPPSSVTTDRVPTLQDYWETWSTTSLPKMSKSKQTPYKIAKRKVERLMLLPVNQLNIKLL